MKVTLNSVQKQRIALAVEAAVKGFEVSFSIAGNYQDIDGIPKVIWTDRDQQPRVILPTSWARCGDAVAAVESEFAEQLHAAQAVCA